MNKDEALRMALEALENIYHGDTRPVVQYKIIKSIREALAQPEQQWTPEDMVYHPGALVRTEPSLTPEQLAALGWQSIECPFCGTSGAQAFPKQEPLEYWNAIEGLVLKSPSDTENSFKVISNEWLVKYE